MASTRKYDLVAKTGEYEQNGEKKARWLTCGAVFENEKGQLSAKINCLPVATEWNGWLTMSVPMDQRSGRNGASSPAPAKAEAQPAAKKEEPINDAPAEAKDDDNLPF